MNGYQTYEINNNSNPDQDRLISQLKAEIFEKEQNQKDFCQLQSKYRNLQNELQLLSEAKLHLEYELRSKTDSGNKSISDLKNQNENLLNDLNEKIAMNKKLYNDNNNLYRNLESKTAENQGLKDQVCEQENILSKLNEDKSNIERQIMQLNQTRQMHNNNIQNLNDQIENLSQQVNDQNKLLNEKNLQNQEILKNLEAQRFDNNNLLGKLKSREDALYKAQEQLELANRQLDKLECDYNILNDEYNKNKSDTVNLNNALAKENSIRTQVEENNQKLEQMINERNEDIKKLQNENDSIQMTLEKLNNDKIKLGNELEGYKRHILVLTEQNEKLAKELECVLDRDMRLLQNLRRNEKLRCVVEQNAQIIENSLNNLKAFLNQSGNVGKYLNNSEMANQSTLMGTKGYNITNENDTMKTN